GELRLADEQDLEQLLPGRLEVRQESDLLQGFRRQVLRLVDDEYGAEALAPPVAEEAIEGAQALGGANAVGGQTEVPQHGLEDAVERQRRVEDQRGGSPGVEAFEQRMEQRRLAGAHLAGQDEKAAVVLDA